MIKRDEDTKPRELGCECQWEEGDSPCTVHGLYEADLFHRLCGKARTEYDCEDPKEVGY